MKKLLILLAIIITVLSIYSFVKIYNKKTYNKGLETGRIEIINNIIRQLQNTGELKLRIGVDDQGQDIFLILKPQQ